MLENNKILRVDLKLHKERGDPSWNERLFLKLGATTKVDEGSQLSWWGVGGQKIAEILRGKPNQEL